MNVEYYLNNDAHGQDRLIVADPLYAVIDGVSSSNGGFAADVLERILLEDRPSSPSDVLESIERAHKAIVWSGMTTIAGVLRQEDIFYCFSVGDSSTYAANTLVHHLDNEVFPGGLPDPARLEQAIGWRYFMHDTHIPLQPVMLATDGITDNIDISHLYSKKRVLNALNVAKQNNESRVYGRFKHDDQALIVLNP